jgi:hypothetical protein
MAKYTLRITPILVIVGEDNKIRYLLISFPETYLALKWQYHISMDKRIDALDVT